LTTSRTDIDSATARAARERALVALRRQDLGIDTVLNREGAKDTKEGGE
jgi:hypothetical protein